MARAKSEDKRNAILLAATQVIAEHGLAAATAKISDAAGVAEGTLFTYFKTKDELLNALYCSIKWHLADAMMSAFPRKKKTKSKLAHVWSIYVDWGLKNPVPQKALRQIEVWTGLTSESKLAAVAPFLEIEEMMKEAADRRVVKNLPESFAPAVMACLAETVMELIRRDPANDNAYRTAGFEMLWAGIVRK